MRDWIIERKVCDSSAGKPPSTMRGMLHEHALDVSAPTKTLRLDGGAPVGFTGDERDLQVVGEHGELVHVNVTGLDPSFVGKVPIGVAGRVRRIYRDLRKVDGVWIPFSEERLVDGQPTMTFTWNRVAFNTGVKEALFRRPGTKPTSRANSPRPR